MRLKMVLACALAGVVSACTGAGSGPSALPESNQLPASAMQPLRAQTLVLDNVTITITSHLPVGDFTASTPGKPSQLAWAISRSPLRFADVETIPYGFGSPLEQSLVAEPGIAQSKRRATMLLYEQRMHAAQKSITATMFGRTVTGTAYIDADAHASGGYRGSAQFSTEAGGRLWSIDVAEDLAPSDFSAFFNGFSGLSLSSPNPDRPTTLAHTRFPTRAEMRAEHPPQSVDANAASALRKPMYYTGWYVQNPPPWWTVQPNTPCDYQNYWNNTPSSVPSAFQLYSGDAGVNNPWHGLVACGPNPDQYPNSEADVLVQFYGGAWGEYEWECVELSMRWMYEAYGTHTYGANGNTIASNYNTGDGGNLEYIPNGGYPPLPVPGDVLQYQGGTYGHTSVVVAESHNSSGNGTVYVIEQNNGNYAGNALSETNWYVNCASDGSGCPNAWLHQP